MLDHFQLSLTLIPGEGIANGERESLKREPETIT